MSTFGIGLLGVAGIVACLYMAEHGYEWWQIGLMALFTLTFAQTCWCDLEILKEER